MSQFTFRLLPHTSHTLVSACDFKPCVWTSRCPLSLWLAARHFLRTCRSNAGCDKRSSIWRHQYADVNFLVGFSWCQQNRTRSPAPRRVWNSGSPLRYRLRFLCVFLGLKWLSTGSCPRFSCRPCGCSWPRQKMEPNPPPGAPRRPDPPRRTPLTGWTPHRATLRAPEARIPWTARWSRGPCTSSSASPRSESCTSSSEPCGENLHYSTDNTLLRTQFFSQKEESFLIFLIFWD